MPFVLSLRSKIIGIFLAMIAIVVLGGAAMHWYTYQIDKMLSSIMQKEFVIYKTALNMELALANQKGFLTYYVFDGDEKWLKSLWEYRQIFHQYLKQVKNLPLNPNQRQTINSITLKYQDYVQAKDMAIESYRRGIIEESISSLHEKQRDVFFSLLELCRTFSQDQWQLLKETEEKNSIRSERLRIMALTALGVFAVLCTFFLYILYTHILEPIRELALKTGSSARESSIDEVDSLQHSLGGMMREFDETSEMLVRSRKHLLQAERMAMVGELAAGVAHTIRNPFTSIKMRMFSLGRSLKMTEAQDEDLQVISDEISRIDKIVENFLEFARPPKLKLQECSQGELINAVLTLLEYRLRAYNVELNYTFRPELGKVKVDPDRIKEALANLIINGCEAMETGGRISIDETRENHETLGEVAVITISDSGPGIPETIIDKVTTPFFTTKEDGSGLGLSIVARIIKEHNGKFIISSKSGQGATFIIILPTGEKAS
ncbi:MAG: ATP-binding protein [Desulforhopalus sp.]